MITIDAVDRVLGGPEDDRIHGPDPHHGQGTLPRRTGARAHMMSMTVSVSAVIVNVTSPRHRGDARGMSQAGAVVARGDMQSRVVLGTEIVSESGSATVNGNGTAINVSSFLELAWRISWSVVKNNKAAFALCNISCLVCM